MVCGFLRGEDIVSRLILRVRAFIGISGVPGATHKPINKFRRSARKVNTSVRLYYRAFRHAAWSRTISRYRGRHCSRVSVRYFRAIRADNASDKPANGKAVICAYNCVSDREYSRLGWRRRRRRVSALDALPCGPRQGHFAGCSRKYGKTAEMRTEQRAICLSPLVPFAGTDKQATRYFQSVSLSSSSSSFSFSAAAASASAG